MGDDSNITIIVPEPQPESSTETSYEEIGEQLLARLDILDQRIEELSNALAACIERIIALEGREYAAIEHEHSYEGLAEAGHTHDGYASSDHTHQEHKREKDKEPENQHPYFRRVPDRG